MGNTINIKNRIRYGLIEDYLLSGTVNNSFILLEFVFISDGGARACVWNLLKICDERYFWMKLLMCCRLSNCSRVEEPNNVEHNYDKLTCFPARNISYSKQYCLANFGCGEFRSNRRNRVNSTIFASFSITT